MIGPRCFGSGAPHLIGWRMVAAFGSGWEVSRIWVERLGELMNDLPRKTGRLPLDRPESLLNDPCKTGAKLRCRQWPGGLGLGRGASLGQGGDSGRGFPPPCGEGERAAPGGGGSAGRALDRKSVV